jgi:hypothetical protein
MSHLIMYQTSLQLQKYDNTRNWSYNLFKTLIIFLRIWVVPKFGKILRASFHYAWNLYYNGPLLMHKINVSFLLDLVLKEYCFPTILVASFLVYVCDS